MAAAAPPRLAVPIWAISLANALGEATTRARPGPLQVTCTAWGVPAGIIMSLPGRSAVLCAGLPVQTVNSPSST